MSTVIDPNKLRNVITQNQQIPVPSEGPKAQVLLLDASVNVSQTLSLLLTEQTGYISMIQTLFIDMTGIANNLVVTIKGSGQKIFAKAATSGYYPVLCPNPAEFQFDVSAITAAPIPIFLINVPIAGVVWPTA